MYDLTPLWRCLKDVNQAVKPVDGRISIFSEEIAVTDNREAQFRASEGVGEGLA